MKKNLSVILILVLVLSLFCACKKNEQGENQTQTSTSSAIDVKDDDKKDDKKEDPVIEQEKDTYWDSFIPMDIELGEIDTSVVKEGRSYDDILTIYDAYIGNVSNIYEIRKIELGMAAQNGTEDKLYAVLENINGEHSVLYVSELYLCFGEVGVNNIKEKEPETYITSYFREDKLAENNYNYWKTMQDIHNKFLEDGLYVIAHKTPDVIYHFDKSLIWDVNFNEINEEMQYLYIYANEYYFIAMNGLFETTDDCFVDEATNIEYAQIVDDASFSFDSLESIQNDYLGRFFTANRTKEIIEEIQKKDPTLYIEKDGKLYVRKDAALHGADMASSQASEWASIDDNNRIQIVTVTNYDYNETDLNGVLSYELYLFHLEKDGDSLSSFKYSDLYTP